MEFSYVFVYMKLKNRKRGERDSYVVQLPLVSYIHGSNGEVNALQKGVKISYNGQALNCTAKKNDTSPTLFFFLQKKHLKTITRPPACSFPPQYMVNALTREHLP